MKKIVIIVPYFGSFPAMVNLTFHSMAKNETIDWLIFTDKKWISKQYNNIRFIEMSFMEMKDLIKDKLGTLLSSPYKLCDYKPTYGYLFYEYVKDYDFWGYCDLDIIFGNLRNFFTEDKLNKYDKIYDLGHLSIYKNIDAVTEAFMGNEIYHVPYKDILNHKYICVFDEPCNNKNEGINQILKGLGFSVYKDRNEIADIDIRYENFHITARDNYNDFYLIYSNGTLVLKRLHDKSFCQEVAYAHYQQRKNIPIKTNNLNYFASTPIEFTDVDRISENLFYKIDFKFFKYFKYRIKRFYTNKIKAKIWQLFHRDLSKYNFKLP